MLGQWIIGLMDCWINVIPDAGYGTWNTGRMRMPAAKIKEVVANRIILSSPKGQIRAWFDATEEEVVLKLFGSKASLSMCIDSDGNPKISLQNKRNRAAIGIGVSDQFGHGITLNDSEGKPLCFITVPNNGIPKIELFQAVASTRGRRFWKTPAPRGKRQKRQRT
jgi:hypothetical protein